MKISVSDVPAAQLDGEALILALPRDTEIPDAWQPIDKSFEGMISAALAAPGGFSAKGGQVRTLSLRDAGSMRHVVLCGLGKPGKVNVESWRKAVGSGCAAAREHGAKTVGVPVPQIDGIDEATLAGACTEAALLSSYRFQEFKQVPDDQVDLVALTIGSAHLDAAAAIEKATVIAEATCWARDLINRPSNVKRPAALAEEIQEMANAHGLRCEILGADQCFELGMNALLAVGQGSSVPPQLVILEHGLDASDEQPVVLVGKGITFDSGGISIKPSLNMGEMKSDMSGAAAVVATMRAVADLNVPRPVVAMTPLAENMPSATAYRPGDIVRALGEKSIEVVNTDAEGRLVLADALAYARERYKPACMVDLATLTGACVVALGSAAAGLMGTDDALCKQLLAAGDTSGDRLWRLPLWEAYDKMIDSDVADIKNSGGRDAGAITAAKLLQQFVGDIPWAHLDIAGTAFTKEASSYQPKGGTGYGVRLLTQWLTS
jgi:leucyl aminopeptidase